MNGAQKLEALGVEDVQNTLDDRGVLIDQVGIDELSYPISIEGRGGECQQTVSEVCMTVELADHLRGTHMSRFVEVLDDYAGSVGPSSFRAMASEIRSRLESEFSRVSMRFPYFLRRLAPASGMDSLVRYEGHLVSESRPNETTIEIGVRVPVTSLCPCSKEISDYGAHSQRGYVDLTVTSSGSAGEESGIWFEDLVEIAEQAGSAPIYSLLKRSDEREVTMQAYDNPAFVEDIVRNVVVALREDVRVASAIVRVSNQESIHDHSAVAEVRWERASA